MTKKQKKQKQKKPKDLFDTHGLDKIGTDFEIMSGGTKHGKKEKLGF